MWMTDHAFKQRVVEALELIPAEFRPYLENVEIVVEDWPSEDLLAAMGIPEDEGLYGLYTGTPLTERHFDHAGLPDRIILYRNALLEDFPDQDELRREVALTVLHELAHHFGIDEDRLTELGLD
jgi:predicted Zn-dependent protease with MMP-like domain